MTPGYKQTDAGVIPDDWDVKQLGELSSVSAGGTPSRSNANYWGGDIPWITTTEIDFRLITESEQFITSIGLKNSAAKLMPAGALLMALYGQGKTRGKVGVLGFEAATNQACAAIILKEGYSREYAFHYLASRYDEIRKLSNTGNQENLNGALVRSIPVLLPPLSEQSAIATALSDVDALLSSLDALIAKKRDIKQAAMQQLLTGKTRLPGFEGEWTVKRLDQLANIRSGGTPSTTVSRFWDGGIPWCTPTDITRLGGGKYLLDTSRQITSEGLSNSSAELIPANSVVMTSRATIGECAINLKPVTTNQGFKNFVPFEDTDVNFLYYLLQTQKQGFIQLCAGSTFLEIGKTQLAAYKVHLPSTKAEQTAIAEVLSDMDAELAALEARRDKTRLLKQGMMQELLTGKTRLV
ncbi:MULTISPECIES: restriction endonuclease subunit S [pseudomallei group]|uniref:restriction endonuclease subunit S n=1 Tax=pseudomallei group TaxID=111527 RepID=UPI0009784644|nr:MULTISPECIES: restriction endonuclease subunit S [pseudomallei group]MCS3396804.1 restriction endonuclease subunit S [Burkholderia thailandensis]MCS6503755.1 restriction endonuclease subunit S [Burkholderia thailandensis]MCW0091404.1 restriction endonuclease subunit S [Burkholderia pseudomallei]MCW0127042.1 restriction endonuclease subunit S [Burkholderia pseudomallei]MDK2568200.1 restriction endonuclease subunit S [Burkholderia pseudomallei]